MKLPRCPEPTQFGEFSIEEIKKQSKLKAFDFINMVVLNPKGLPSYLWTACNWQSILKEKGMDWIRFEKIIPSFDANIKNWIYGAISLIGMFILLKKRRKTLMERGSMREIIFI